MSGICPGSSGRWPVIGFTSKQKYFQYDGRTMWDVAAVSESDQMCQGSSKLRVRSSQEQLMGGFRKEKLTILMLSRTSVWKSR